jgi:hypothetical protein
MSLRHFRGEVQRLGLEALAKLDQDLFVLCLGGIGDQQKL